MRLSKWIAMVAITTGFVGFNDLRSPEQRERVYTHCTEPGKLEQIVLVRCEDAVYPEVCWRSHFIMCLETWR